MASTHDETVRREFERQAGTFTTTGWASHGLDWVVGQVRPGADEPSLGLAPVVVSQVFETIRRLHAEGLTILLVEQNLKKALETADRGYVVETGSISMEGRSADLLADPTVRAAYLGV